MTPRNVLNALATASQRREGVTHESLRIRQPRQPRGRRQGSSAGPRAAAALSGGTDLLGRMKDYVTSPERVVYLKDIKALGGHLRRRRSPTA